MKIVIDVPKRYYNSLKKLLEKEDICLAAQYYIATGKLLNDYVPVSEIENLRKEMAGISRVNDGEKEVLWNCLCMIDDLLEQYKGGSNDT